MGWFSSAPSSLNTGIIRAVYTRAEYLVLGASATSYSSGQWTEIPGAIVTDMTLRIGPSPSSCIIKIPIDISQTGSKLWEQGRQYTHRVIEPRNNKNELAAFGPPTSSIKLWTKVRIFTTLEVETFSSYLSESTITMPLLFVGYITAMTYAQSGLDYTELQLHCKDARELLRKTPVGGVLFYNPEDVNSASGDTGATVFIRDHPLIFNEGGKANRYHNFADGQFKGDSSEKPRFIRVDYNRFVHDPAQPALFEHSDNRSYYAPDASLESDAHKNHIPNPHARKWYAGQAWNYLRNLIDSSLMVAGGLFDDPVETPNAGELPIARDQEVYIAPVKYVEGANNMYNELFVPRAFVGQTFQTGAGDATSGLGEWNPTGMPYNEALFELLRKVGNYQIAPSYSNGNRLILRPIRTTLAYTEQEDAKVGNCGRSGGEGGKSLTLVIPGDDPAISPNVFSCNITTTSDSYYNRMRSGGVPRIIQATFTTVALNKWVDDLGQTHYPYRHSGNGGNVPANEWLPKLAKPTLVPAWSKDDQEHWLDAFFEFWNKSFLSGNTETYPDVFRTWVIPQEGPNKIDWVAFFGKAADTPGFRRFFDRDREALRELLTKVFDVSLGIFRRRAIKLPIVWARAYRGIRLDATGATAYGDPTTEAGSGGGSDNYIKGYEDWYGLQCDAEVLTDGRLGFRFGPNARLALYDHENQAKETPTGCVTAPSPATWNYLTEEQGAKAYEMLWSIPIILDEDLWEQIDIPNAGADGSYTAKIIEKYGPPMEYYVNGSAEHVYEEAIHSLIHKINPGSDKAMLAIPPVESDGVTDEATRIYNDPTNEMRGWLRMMANRNMTIDQQASITLPYIDLSIKAGDYIREIKMAGSEAQTRLDSIRVNAICVSVTYDFQIQQTLIQLETIK